MQFINKLKNRRLVRSLVVGAVAIVLLGAASGAAYQYNTSQNARTQELSNTTEELQPKKDMDKDSERMKADQKDDPASENHSDESNSNTKNIQFTKGSGHADYKIVSVSQSTSSPQTGTCTYIFTLGNSSVEKSNTIHNSKKCKIDIPVAAFPKSGEWAFNMKFSSTDGTIYGTGGGFPVTVDPQPRTISFRKGGKTSLNGGKVNVSATMSEAHTGTCTYTFSMNGSVKVKETRKIHNSKTCSAKIAKTEFPPKSAKYSLTLSFESSDGGVVAKQSPIDIEVK